MNSHKYGHPAVLAARAEVAQASGRYGAARADLCQLDVTALHVAVETASRRLKAVRALADLTPAERLDVLMLLNEHETEDRA